VTDDGHKGPLWKFVPMVAHVPAVRRNEPAPADPRMLPKEPTAQDLHPLREDGAWRPQIIVKRFGGAKREDEQLPRLVIACAIFQGVHKVRELCERLIAQINIAWPRIERMIEDESLERRHAMLKDLMKRLRFARQDLPATRARASNDVDFESHPDGLRQIDLAMLVTHMEAVILAAECATKRNLTGLDYAAYTAKNPPDQRYVEDWLERALGTTQLSGILLFTPQEYGRVVVVHGDGRLAYDPATPSSGEE
jgi:hypothetical protein